MLQIDTAFHGHSCLTCLFVQLGQKTVSLSISSCFLLALRVSSYIESEFSKSVFMSSNRFLISALETPVVAFHDGSCSRAFRFCPEALE